jgi:hypothetical protein
MRAQVQVVRHARDRGGGQAGRRAQSSDSLRTGGGGEDAVRERRTDGESRQLGGSGGSVSSRRHTHSSLSQSLSHRHLPFVVPSRAQAAEIQTQKVLGISIVT